MRNTIGAIALVGVVLAAPVAIALVATAAFAENRVDEQRAHIAKLWGQGTAVVSQTADTRVNFTGISSMLSFETTAALGATSAFATSPVPEQKREPQLLWDADRSGQGQEAARGDFFSSIFGRIDFRIFDPGTVEAGSNYGQSLRNDTGYGHGAGSGTYRGGRVHPPAGR